MKFLFYKMTNEEPIKMGSANKSSDTEFSMNYIAGSTMRGALIGAFIKNKPVSLDAEKDLKIRLLKETMFLNCYPASSEGERSLPSPLCFMASKQAVNNYEGGRLQLKTVYDLYEAGDKAFRKEPFVVKKGNEYYGIKVPKEFKLHISVNGSASSGGEKAMFRYESIRKGQDFIGGIALRDEDLADEFKKLLDGLELYIGGSKGSGYGKSKLTFLNEAEHESENGTVKGPDDKNDLYIYLISDALITDEYGNPAGSIPVKTLEEKLGLEGVSYSDGSAETIRITGFNSTWGVSMPQTEGIKAGSIFHYTYQSGNSDMDKKAVAFMDEGIGMRRDSGFGRFLIWNKLETPAWQRAKPEKPEKEEKAPALSEEGKKQLQFIAKALYKTQAERAINKEVVRVAGTLGGKRADNSQLGKLAGCLNGLQYKGIQEAETGITGYFAQLQERTNNLRYYRQYEEMMIEGKHSDQYLKDFIANSDNVQNFIKRTGFEIPEFALRAGYMPTKQEVYFYNMIFLQKLLQFLNRMEARR